MRFGRNVRKLRKEKKLSLEELSKKCGVSRSMLSQIEREEKNPTIQVACQIAEGLNTTLSRLLGEQEEKEALVIRKGERLIYRDEQSGFERHLLSPSFPSRGVEFILNIIPPGKESGAFPPHLPGVKEYIVVDEGRLKVELAGGKRKYELEPGDSIYFEADVEHRFINAGNGECRYYLVIDSNQAK